MNIEENLAELYNKTQFNNDNEHKVNLQNLMTYMAINDINTITKDSLISFFGDNLTKPNKNGEFLTNILACHAFRGSCTIEKTTKLFSFIYEIINPNLPGKTCGLCSLVEFIILSSRILQQNDKYYCLEKKNNKLYSDNEYISYIEFLLRINIKNGLDLKSADYFGHSVIFYIALICLYGIDSSYFFELKDLNLNEYIDFFNIAELYYTSYYTSDYSLQNWFNIEKILIKNNYPELSDYQINRLWHKIPKKLYDGDFSEDYDRYFVQKTIYKIIACFKYEDGYANPNKPVVNKLIKTINSNENNQK
mgnify:FL=1